MNFLVWEMTYLRYFIPLILEGNKRGIRSKVFVDYSCHKYNSPKNNKDKLVALSQEYAFDLLPIEDASECTGVTFVIEGILREYCKKSTCVSIPYGTDFVSLWSKYINEVDHVIMPTEFIAQRYDRVSDKNLYLGSPKFDVVLDKDIILDKYRLENNKKALIAFPRLKYFSNLNINAIYSVLHSLGYEVLVKTRGKDPVPVEYRGDKYYEDYSWHPHTTMELLEVSDILINFDSATIKEAVYSKKPVINFRVKPHLPYDFLYEYPFCYSRKASEITRENLIGQLQLLTDTDYSIYYKEAFNKISCENSSKKILDWFKLK